MHAAIDHRPQNRSFDIYVGDIHGAVTIDSNGVRLYEELPPGALRPVFLSLSTEEYIAIRDAIIERESHHLGQNSLLRESLERERELADRLLTLVERDY